MQQQHHAANRDNPDPDALAQPGERRGRHRVTGTITLTGAPSGAATVTVSSSSTAATVPASASIAAGATGTTFTISTTAVTASTTVTITATYAGVTPTLIQTATLTVTPATTTPPVAAPTLSSISLSAASVVGGSSVTGTALLSGAAPTGGIAVTLSSNDAAGVITALPASITVAAGATSATFTVTTRAVGGTFQVVITGAQGGKTATATLSVQPPACAYTIAPASQAAAASAGTFTATVGNTSGNCTWTAAADSAFITLSGATTGTGAGTINYSVAANTGVARAGTITIAWSGGSVQLTVNQAASATPAPPSAAGLVGGFQLFDPAAQKVATTECRFRSNFASDPTTCTIQSTSFTLGTNTIVKYDWIVQYTYGGLNNLQQSGSNANFSFSDTCGLPGSTDDGVAQALTVQLTITDSLGSTLTVSSGSGNQPALQVRLFTCGH